MKNMKKGIITAGMSAVIACAIMLCCRVTGRENMPETDNASPARSEQRVKKVAASGRALVAYFSVPETDGVDASSGASRLVVDGKVTGNTAYVASVISEAAGADLFEIKTVRTYPASHKALIDAAKVEVDNDARPEPATHIADLKDYDVVFVGFPNWWYGMPMPLYSFFRPIRHWRQDRHPVLHARQPFFRCFRTLFYVLPFPLIVDLGINTD